MRTLAAPSTLLGGRYIVREALGAGGWGAVYEATQKNLDRAVAVKVLHPDLALSPDRLARFAFEARAAGALGHPNIVQIIDFQSEPNEPAFIVMERLNGATLAKLVESEARLAPGRVVRIALQVLSALEAAHAAGIIHRDVKPENVFLVTAAGLEDFVKLLDFGIAKLVDDTGAQATTAGALIGSPAFMAPEQITAEELDARVDLYALGATMYRALTGALPFEGPNIHSLLFAIASTAFKPVCEVNPDVPRELAAIVERALARDRNDRFASAADMRAALAALSISDPKSGAITRSKTEPMPAVVQTETRRISSPPLPATAADAGANTAPLSASRTRLGAIGALVALVSAAVPTAFYLTQTDRTPHEPGSNTTSEPSASTPGAGSIVAIAPSMTTAPGRASASRPTPAPAPTHAPIPAPSTAPSSEPTYGGSTARFAGGALDGYTEDEVRSALGPVTSAINTCFAAAVHEPPEHQKMAWTLTHDVDGRVKAVHPATPFGRAAKLDACMGGVLGGVRLPSSAKAGDVKLDFASPKPAL